MKIPSAALRKIALIVPRLGSPHDGEILAAVKAIGRTLATTSHGFTDLGDVLMPSSVLPDTPVVKRSAPASWKQTAQWCARYGLGILTERELAFCDDLAGSRGFRALSARQEAWLDSIREKLSMKGAA